MVCLDGVIQSCYLPRKVLTSVMISRKKSKGESIRERVVSTPSHLSHALAPRTLWRLMEVVDLMNERTYEKNGWLVIKK